MTAAAAGARTLNDLIRDVAEEFPDAHPYSLAEMVAKRTAPDDLMAFYITALQRVVSDRIRTGRNAALNSPTGRSPKLAERAAWQARIMAERVHVGDLKYKTIADCTIENLLYYINERRDQINAINGQIEKFETIVAAMQLAGVDTAGELPEWRGATVTAILQPIDFPDTQGRPESHCGAGVGEPNLPDPRTAPEATSPTDQATNFPGAQLEFASQVRRGVGDQATEADAVHATECKRCGPKGKPAQPGSPLSPGHQNARAIRLIAKAILRDLWTESKAIHEQKEIEL